MRRFDFQKFYPIFAPGVIILFCVPGAVSDLELKISIDTKEKNLYSSVN